MSDSSSSVFDDLKREMEDTGKSLKQLVSDAKSDDSSKGEVKRELKQEAESTGQSVESLIDDIQTRADRNDNSVTEQLKQEFESFRSK
ncbi:hypothetical protein [Halorarius halobius]|uniref:hypothetical protein n=1 Tax=Halorarius halobius TaxID=2962671 RepID=UPI0020CD5259|nr:hypothetical protein [Halorarius halobius]